ncbi:DUF11 domain-containing protein [Paenibacillus sp. CF384]|uniref:DUF11 domain-containing protein n=1 Tax=Paenibacillus sp. CF384 TaxID=1884382 RepID=UPI000895B0EE|nr:DUF11 domain-containing protein [Paenibacillus sp. CF384]SDW13332.1 conserved repeat domain-containing protein [Paenibacillus sp. CF384]
MMAAPDPPQTIRNQSVVSFSSAGSTSFSYSNIVNTAVNGPVIAVVLSTTSTQAGLTLPVTYQITVSNSGNRSANVTVVDVLPPGTVFVANSVIVNGSPVPGVTPDGGIPIGDVAPGSTVTIYFQLLLVSAPPSGQLDNQATANYYFVTTDGRTITGSETSNIVSLPVTVQQVSLLKGVNTAYTYTGDMLVYTVIAANEGTEPMRQCVLYDALPQGTLFVQGSVTINGVRSPSASPIAGIMLGLIQPGISVTVTFSAIVLDVPVHTQLSNSAELRFQFGTFDQSVSSNTVSSLVSGPALAVNKSASLSQATVGQSIRYTITIYNSGTTGAEVTVRDAIPAGALFTQGSAEVNGRPLPGANPDAGIQLGFLQPGLQYVLSFLVTVTRSGNQSELINRATVEYAFRLPSGVLVTDAVTTNDVVTSVVVPIIRAELSAAPPIVGPGEYIAVSVAITNTGNYAAAVTLFALIPDETSIEIASIRINGVEVPFTPGEGLPIGILALNQTIIVTYRLRVSAHPLQNRLRFRVLAQFSYEVNGELFTNSVYSNEVTIVIETHEE